MEGPLRGARSQHVWLLCLACAIASCDDSEPPAPVEEPFECEDGRGEIPISWRCDHHQDCVDGSDEAGCGFDCRPDGGVESVREDVVCDGVLDCSNGADEIDVDWMDTTCNNFFTCDRSQALLPSAQECDSYIDCPDGSDEAMSKCGGFEVITCQDGSGLALACDDRIECDDGSDELSSAGCSTFECEDGTRLPEVWVCDGLADCAGREDEPDDTCSDRRFTCASSDYFIPKAWECDTRLDCEDGSDEADCEGRIFACDDFNSIPDELLCDDKRHCPDGSDEIAEVACPDTAFECDDGDLIICLYRCDGYDDCLDGEDELDCPEFACADGTPKPAAFRCDLVRDCLDGSDEADCDPDGPLGLCPAR